MKVLTLVLPMFSVFFVPVLMAQSESGFVDVSECISIADADERYACFDEVTEHLQNQVGQDNEITQDV